MKARTWFATMLAVATITPLAAGAATAAAAGPSARPAASVAQAKGGAHETIKVSKCFINSGGQMLIKASSTNASATLTAYRPDGTVIGQVQNGGGSRYGGTVMPYQPYDPKLVTIRSSAGGSVTVPTTPFQI